MGKQTKKPSKPNNKIRSSGPTATAATTSTAATATTTINHQASNMSASSEPLLTFLMPLYAMVSWVSVLFVKDTDLVLLCCSVFGGLWALRNNLHNRKLDLGVFTMGSLAITEALDMYVWKEDSSTIVKLVIMFETLLVAVNFFAPYAFWKSMEKSLARHKTMFWFQVFRDYLAIMGLFWIYAASKLYKNAQEAVLAKQAEA